VFVQDAQVMAVYDALEMIRRGTSHRIQDWFDPLSMNQRIAFVGATSGHFASIVSMLRLRELNPFMSKSLQCFSILQSVDDLVNALNAFAPTVIATYPTVAALLANEAGRGALTFSPSEVWTGGETLTNAVRSRLERAWGCSVHNSYGASEFMSIGWECSLGHMHANSDWVILEPVDEKGRAVPHGHASYSTLLTNLANHVQPLIRYDLGDQLTVHAEACACGSPLPVIEVRGRRDDPLVMKGAHGQPVTLLPLALTTVLEDEAGVFDFQLLQQNDHALVLRLGASGEAADVLEARCRAALAGFASTLGLAPLQVKVELSQTIQRGRSGKAQRVVARHGSRRQA
jgi:phenylacetate-coenzyme A ligase PaaK-like adenylate-forming protein